MNQSSSRNGASEAFEVWWYDYRIKNGLGGHTAKAEVALDAFSAGVKAERASRSETATPLDEAIRRIEQSRDARWYEHGGSHDPETNEPIGASDISDWLEGMDDAIEVIRALKEGR